MPIVVVGELYVGAEYSQNSFHETLDLDLFFDGVGILETTKSIAKRYGRIFAKLKCMGKPIPVNDVWIAATAMERGLPLVARDVHFDLVEGLEILKW